MKSISLPMIILSLSQLIIAEPETFNMLFARSSPDVAYSSIYNKDSKLYIGTAKNTLCGAVTNEGKLKLSQNSYAVVSEDGTIVEGGEENGTTGFSLNNDTLELNNVSNFCGVSKDGTYLLSTKCDNSNSLSVLVSTKGSSDSFLNSLSVGTMDESDDDSPFTLTSTLGNITHTTVMGNHTTLSVDMVSSTKAGNNSVASLNINKSENAAIHIGSFGLGVGMVAAAAFLI